MVPKTGQFGITRLGSAVRKSSGHERAGAADRATVVELAPDRSASVRDRHLSELAGLTEADSAATGTREALFALVSKGATGDYTNGQIEHLESDPTSSGASGADSAKETRRAEENCKAWGYSNFSEASP
jgi:hypothetical protein